MPERTKKPSDIADKISEVDKLNAAVRHKHAISYQSRYINIIDEIIDKSVTSLKNGTLKIFFNTLGVEHDENSWLDIQSFFRELRKAGCFEREYTDKEQYIFEGINISNLKIYRELLLEELPKRPITKRLPGLPENISWENITIKFADRHVVNVTINKDDRSKTLKLNYAQLGFMNKKDKEGKPNVQWLLLEQLSQLNGKISWEDSQASPLIKKKKQLLSETLKQVFDIEDDPFYPYKENKCYEIKIQLIPE